MTIGKLAAAAGVATSTVRFYERRGLLRPDRRSAGNYREYDEKSLERLRLIRSAQAVGLSIRDVSELLKLTMSEGSPCKDIDSLLHRRLDDVRQRMKDLRRIERTLTRSIETCCRGKDPGLCETVNSLRGRKNAKCP
jgi:MerR family mercuric resistance operon transcriptional regulator